MNDAIVYLVLGALIVGIYFFIRRISGNNSRRRGLSNIPNGESYMAPRRRQQLTPVPVRPNGRHRPLTPVSRFDSGSDITCEVTPLIRLVETQLSSCVPRTAKRIYRRLRKAGINMPFSIKAVERALRTLSTNNYKIRACRVPGAKHQGYLVA